MLFSVCRIWGASTLNVRLHKQCVDNGCFCLLNHLPMFLSHVSYISYINFISIHVLRLFHDMTWYGYGSIPINTIFRGMNIHKSQLFWGSPGVQGFDSYPYNYIPFKSLWSPHSSYHRFSMVEIPLCEARVYERFVNKTLRELNGMAGIFRRFTRAKSREAGRSFGRWHRFLGFGLWMMVIFRYDDYICTYYINGYIYNDT